MSSTYAISPDGTPLIGFGPDANCTLATCPISLSVFQYRPSLAANATLLAVFGVLMCVQGWQGWRTRTWGYMGCVVAGCVLQMVGYGGRIMLNGDPFGFDAFLMQIICITVAPVFYCAAVYVLLSQFINLADPSLSRFPPTLFYYLFIPADVTCLVLQATGGALSATGETLSAVDTGVAVSKAGLILQVVVLVIFLGFFIDYLVLYRKKHGGDSTVLRELRVFLGFVFSGVLLILVRCIYRVVELKDGYFGEEFRKQWEFVGLEGVVMCVAVICLCIGHPGWSLYRIKGQGMTQEDIELNGESERRSPSSSEDLKDQAV